MATNVSPTPRSLLSPQLLVDHRVGAAQVAAAGPASPRASRGSAPRRRSPARSGSGSPRRSRPRPRSGCSEAARRARRRRSSRPPRRRATGMSEKPSVFARNRSPAIVLSIASSIEPRMPGREHRYEGDERQADHQRGGGGGRAARVSHRVLARDPPGMPRRRSSGRPTSEARGATSRGLSSATPMNTPAAPTPTQISPGVEDAEQPQQHRHDARGPPDATPTTLRRARSRRRLQHGALAQPGDRLDPGGAQGRDQRREDSEAACRAAARRSPSAPRSPSPCWGGRPPSALNSALDRGREGDPRQQARAPRRRARSPAPPAPPRRRSGGGSPRAVRSIANSRVRCATVIENVLKIRNEATKSATPAKIKSAVFRKPMNSPTSSSLGVDVLLAGLGLDRVGQRMRRGWRRAAPA